MERTWGVNESPVFRIRRHLSLIPRHKQRIIIIVCIYYITRLSRFLSITLAYMYNLRYHANTPILFFLILVNDPAILNRPFQLLNINKTFN